MSYYSKGIISITEIYVILPFPTRLPLSENIPLLYEPHPGKDAPIQKACSSNNYPCSLEAKSFDDFISKMK